VAWSRGGGPLHNEGNHLTGPGGTKKGGPGIGICPGSVSWGSNNLWRKIVSFKREKVQVVASGGVPKLTSLQWKANYAVEGIMIPREGSSQGYVLRKRHTERRARLKEKGRRTRSRAAKKGLAFLNHFKNGKLGSKVNPGDGDGMKGRGKSPF